MFPAVKIVTFTPFEAHDPEHCWLHRWCLLCHAPHPIDAGRPEAIAIQAAIEATRARMRDGIGA